MSATDGMTAVIIGTCADDGTITNRTWFVSREQAEALAEALGCDPDDERIITAAEGDRAIDFVGSFETPPIERTRP